MLTGQLLRRSEGARQAPLVLPARAPCSPPCRSRLACAAQPRQRRCGSPDQGPLWPTGRWSPCGIACVITAHTGTQCSVNTLLEAAAAAAAPASTAADTPAQPSPAQPPPPPTHRHGAEASNANCRLSSCGLAASGSRRSIFFLHTQHAEDRHVQCSACLRARRKPLHSRAQHGERRGGTRGPAHV
jgi:hypothetical protein